MKKISVSVLCSLFFIFGTIAITQAVTNTTLREDRQEEIEAKKAERQNAIEERRDKIEANKEEKIEERCQKIEEKIQNRIQNLNQNHENRKEAYDQIENKIENLIANLKKQGYDVNELEEAFNDFQTLLDTFYTEHEKLMTELNNTENYACGKSEGEFKNQLNQAREQLKIAHQARIVARKNFVEELRPTLTKLREEIINQNNENINASGEESVN